MGSANVSYYVVIFRFLCVHVNSLFLCCVVWEVTLCTLDLKSVPFITLDLESSTSIMFIVYIYNDIHDVDFCSVSCIVIGGLCV